MNSIGSSRRLHMPIMERLEQKSAGATKSAEHPGSFPELLASGVSHVNGMQQGANAQVHDLLTGGDVSQVEVMTSVQKADMAFRLLVQVRNKLMAAYEEINAIRI